MSNWMNDFLSRCLKGVPEGSYRDRTEKELRDHMEVLAWSLEKAGYTPVEAQAEARSRMGNPAELARRYVREWRRRTLRRRALVTVEQLLVGTVMVVMAYLYTINTANFGKGYPALWAFVAIPAVLILLCGSLTGKWILACLSSLVIIMIQPLPMQCWMVFGTFEMSGMMVSRWMGFGIHLLFFAWGMLNYHLAARFQQEEDVSSRTQNA